MHFTTDELRLIASLVAAHTKGTEPFQARLALAIAKQQVAALKAPKTAPVKGAK